MLADTLMMGRDFALEIKIVITTKLNFPDLFLYSFYIKLLTF